MENLILNSPLIQINQFSTVDSVQGNNFENELNGLIQFKIWYEEQNTSFDLAKLESLWSNLQNKSNSFNLNELKSWIEITGFILEITAKDEYAEELETIVHQVAFGFSESEIIEIENLLIPFIFTKNVDHIYVNLFVNSTVKYEHTLKGAVEITQETDFPESGKVKVKFNMENKRYIELYIRIPEWAEGATVVEKGVKYVAVPGTYCPIARKWKEGDFVEITFPSEKIPASIKSN
ncbi:MAG TPA: hypothetical protein VK872_15485 [Draconibacterium sp.]|nr:hypothetical protein [Draconibacterium sp.]